MSQTTTDRSPATRSGMNVIGVAAGVVLAVLDVIAVTSISWLHLPANPVAKVPALTLKFSDLKASTETKGVPTTWLQHAFFHWLAWVMIIALLVLAVAAARAAGRNLANVTSLAALVAVVLTVLALKGPLTWSQFSDQASNVQLGGWLFLVATALSGVVVQFRRRTEA